MNYKFMMVLKDFALLVIIFFVFVIALVFIVKKLQNYTNNRRNKKRQAAKKRINLMPIMVEEGMIAEIHLEKGTYELESFIPGKNKKATITSICVAEEAGQKLKLSVGVHVLNMILNEQKRLDGNQTKTSPN